jgi:gliding motility-associated-like protein
MLTGFVFYGSRDTVQTGEKACIEILGQNFTDVLSMQWTYNFNPDILRFDTAYSVNLPGFTFANLNLSIPGQLSLSWLDPSPTLSGVTIPNCEVLFTMCFTALGQAGTQDSIFVNGIPTSIEVTDKDERLLNPKFVSGSVVIADDTPPCTFSATGAVTDIACKGTSSGAIDLTPAGQTSGFSYRWSYQNLTTEDIREIPAGNYSVTVSNCNTSQTYNFTVREAAAPLVVAVDNQKNNPCFGDRKGEIHLTVAGGWGSYVYNWGGSLPNSPDLTGLAAGNYTVIVRDAGLCRDTIGPIRITQPTTSLRITSAIVRDENCAGRANGLIDITAGGGTPLPNGSYIYLWSPSTSPTSEDQVNLAKGTYFLTLTDANNCGLTDSYTVGEAQPINVQVTRLQNAPNGSVDITVTGGVPSPIPPLYRYSWTGPGNFRATTEDITDLCPGNYTVSILDFVDCPQTTSVTVGGSCMTFNGVTSTKTCPGEKTGSIQVGVSGGANPTIQWNGPGGPHPNTFTLSNLGAGSYEFTITDASINLVQQTVVIDNHPAIVISTGRIVDAVGGLANGSIDANVAGGTGNFRYSWKPGDASTQDLADITPGDYTLTVLDRTTGCSATQTFTVRNIDVVSITSGAVSQVTCNGGNNGSFTVSFPKGTPPFSLSVNGSTIASGITDRTYTVGGRTAGTYNIEVKDANNTTASTTVVINQPVGLTERARKTPKTESSKGSIDLTVNGGLPPYRFVWNNGATSEDLFNLDEGCYKATVTDANNCIFITSEYCIGFFRVARAQVTDVKCANDTNGSISISVAGGDEPYSYEWSSAQGIVGRDSLLQGIGAGTYNVRIIGTGGTVIIAGPYTINARSAIQVSTQPTTNFGGFNIACAGTQVGAARAISVKGVEPYAFAWSNGRTTATIDNLLAGRYTVTVTDAIGCKSVSEVELTEPEPLRANASVKHESCNAKKDGEIQLSPAGGIPFPSSPRYRYQWEGLGQTGSTVRFLSAGTYSVTISDVYDCQLVEKIEVKGPSAPMKVNVVTTDDDGSRNGSAFAEVTGGTSPYKFTWAIQGADQNDNPITSLRYGFYVVTVEDALGCTEIGVGEVRNKSFDCLTSRAVITPDGDGLNENFILYCIEDYPDNKLEIYNRWGQLVFEAEDYDNTWTGTSQRGAELPDGAYFFIFEYRDRDGQLQQMKGSFTLMRE